MVFFGLLCLVVGGLAGWCFLVRLCLLWVVCGFVDLIWLLFLVIALMC